MLTLTFTLALSIAAGEGASAVSTNWPHPTLNFTPGGWTSPKQLPRHEYAPIAANIFGKIKTTDGSHPSALREAVVDIDKDVRIETRGLPVCGRRKVAGNGVGDSRKACVGAVVGSGKASIETLSAEGQPLVLTSPLTLFNGGTMDGETKLFIHALVSRPRPAALVALATIQKKSDGLHSVVTIPPIAGGGSLVNFSFKLGRKYIYKGKERSYLEAKCPDEAFKVSIPKVLFKNEAGVTGVAPTTMLKGGLAVPCTSKG